MQSNIEMATYTSFMEVVQYNLGIKFQSHHRNDDGAKNPTQRLTPQVTPHTSKLESAQVAAHTNKSKMCWVDLIEGWVQCSMSLYSHSSHFLVSLSHTRGQPGGRYHILLDIEWHLFGQKPTCKQDVGVAIFGFGQADNEVISKGLTFPLFVRDQTKITRKFTYLGNYIATKLDPVAWEKLSEEVCFFHAWASNWTPTDI